jgi:hypothetical protein
MRSKIIFELYDNVVTIDEEAGCFDTEGNLVTIDEALVQQRLQEASNELPLAILRIERNRRLQETDWTQYRDVQLENDAAWREYRQALRDMPATQVPLLDENGVLYNITWPEKPE